MVGSISTNLYYADKDPIKQWQKEKTNEQTKKQATLQPFPGTDE